MKHCGVGTRRPVITGILLSFLLVTGLTAPIKEPAAGDTVNMTCMEDTADETCMEDDTNPKCYEGFEQNNVTQIDWTKENGTHRLLFSNWNCSASSNFTDSRISFPEFPIFLEIRNANPTDSGNYTCRLTRSAGIRQITWRLRVSEKPLLRKVEFLSAVGSVVVVLIILLGLISWKKYQKKREPPRRIYQMSDEEYEERKVGNIPAENDCVFKTNSLYIGLSPLGGGQGHAHPGRSPYRSPNCPPLRPSRLKQ